jgi:hypothetical protein
MKKFNYLAGKKRMVESLSDGGGGCYNADCSKCPLSVVNNKRGFTCHEFELKCPKEASEIVKKWAEEHPGKTLKDVLLEKFPNALLNEDGTPAACTVPLGLIAESDALCSYEWNMHSCTECWNQEVED